MQEVTLSEWYDQVEDNTKAIYQVKDQIKSCTKKVDLGHITRDEYISIRYNIRNVLCFWTGNTYVGREKSEKYKKAFQMFFTELMKFIIQCKSSKNEDLQEFADRTLYQGKLYRYLGHGSDNCDYHKRIEPIYDGIYVSWSKNNRIQYIEGKLHGIMTLLICEVKGANYGIDLAEFEVVRGNEEEVVFPTIEYTITNIEYIDLYK